MEENKTPQFNIALETYYNEHRDLIRICNETNEQFEISIEMYELYKKLDLPLPTISPGARLQRLRAHMGGIELFARQDINANNAISMYDPQSPAKIVSSDYWFSDEFNALSYGKELNPQKSFFEQWKIFSPSVPREAISTDPDSNNCTWCVYDLAFKDCYATFGGMECNKIMFGDMCINAGHSSDVGNIVRSEWCYESITCFECSQARYSAFCAGSMNISFCFGCNNISDCFGCVNIQNKQYCFFNQQLSKEEYMRRTQTLDLSDRAVVEICQEKVRELWNTGYCEANSNANSEHAIGDEISDSKNVMGISVLGLERVYNTFDSSFLKDCIDITTCTQQERSALSIVCPSGFENKMCVSCFACINIEYSMNCISSENLFGCIGLKHKKFCIFNVQYSEEEYWKKVDDIKTAMLKRGEYGQFFPYNTSLFAYNTSHADAFFPLDRQAVEHINARWYEFPQVDASQALPSSQIPEQLNKTTEDILTKQFVCPTSGRPFRIVKPELTFHQKMNVALPIEHPSIRRKRKYKEMGSIQLFKRSCVECHKELYTRFPNIIPQKIACSECFNKILLEDRMMK